MTTERSPQGAVSDTAPTSCPSAPLRQIDGRGKSVPAAMPSCNKAASTLPAILVLLQVIRFETKGTREEREPGLQDLLTFLAAYPGELREEMQVSGKTNVFHDNNFEELLS